MNVGTSRSEPKIRSRLVIVGLLVVPAFIALVAFAKFSEPIALLPALEHAQLARHIASGDGFATSVFRPLASTLAPPLDLLNAPVHPLLLAGVFAAAGTSDRAVIAVGLGLWLLTVWLVFWIARYWWDRRVAGLAAIFCMCSLAGLQTAMAGLPQPVLALLILGVVAAIFPKPGTANEGGAELSLWRVAVAGALCGATILTDYRMLPLALVLGMDLQKNQKRRAQVVSWFVAGLLLVLAPWWIRNLMASGRLFGLYGYSALENTRQFPGETIWRMTEIPPHPLLYLMMHPWDLIRKLALGFAQYRRSGLGPLEPVTLLLCIVALFGAPAKTSRRRLAGIAISCAILSALFSCLTQPDAQLLLAWTPVLACVAAAQFVAWGQVNVEGFTAVKLRLRLNATMARRLTYAGIGVMMAFPVVMQFGRNYASRPVDIEDGVSKRLPEDGVVFTDVPAFVAWRWKRPALLLCQRETDLVELEKHFGKITSIYLSPALTQIPQQEVGDWWMWMASIRGIYRGLVVSSSGPLPGLLRLPQETKLEMAAELELERLENVLNSNRQNLQSSEAQTQLAFAYLKLGRLWEAHHAFQEVIRRDHDNIDALIGLWQTLAQLQQSDGTLRLARLASQVTARDLRAKSLLEEAAAHLEQVNLQSSGDPWLLLNLLNCRVRLGQWKEVEACSLQLAQALPKTFPVRLMLANLYLQQGEIAKATAESNQLVLENPNLPIAHQLAGQIWLSQDKLELALKEFEVAAVLRPQFVEAHVQAGQICHRLQRLDDGINHLVAALKLTPNSVSIRLNLAAIYLAQSKTDTAIGLYREVLAIEPEQPIALNELANLLAQTGKTTEALQFAHLAVNRDPQNSHVRDTAGWVAFLSGNYEEALLHLWEAVRLTPNQGLSHFHLGKVHLAQGRTTEARQSFQRALEYGLPANLLQEAQSALTGG